VIAAPRKDIRHTRGLGLLLPIRRGERVLVVGRDQAPLLASLVRSGAAVTYVADGGSARDGGVPADVAAEVVRPGDALPVKDAGADHVIFVAASAGWRTSGAKEVARVCRPGGHLAMVVPNRLHRRAESAWSPREVREHLAVHGFEVLETYGVRERITDVRHLVPMGGPVAAWYVRHAALSPMPRSRALLMRLLGAAGIPAVVSPLFPALAVTARRSERSC
jgi:SAM-dependent methyltransferase